MPITHDIRPDLALIISTHVGSISDDEFLASYKALFDDPRFDLGYNRLVDLRKANSGTRSPEALYAFARFMEERYRDAEAAPKTAVIAPRDISFGLARMYEAYTDLVPGDFVVFRAADAALAWLKAPEGILGGGGEGDYR